MHGVEDRRLGEVGANYTLTNVCNNFGSRTTRFKLEVL